MKLIDIQSALLKDRETTFTLKGETYGSRFVIESLETEEETFEVKWKQKTRTVNYAVGTLYWFFASEESKTSYNGSFIEAKPARFHESRRRVRISQVEELGWEENLEGWKARHLANDAQRVANEVEKENADLHLAKVLTEALGVTVTAGEASTVTKTIREALLNHFTTINA